jgi:hypothetical protein
MARWILASNPVVTTTISNADKLKQILTTLTDAVSFIEQILAAVGVGGASTSEIERMTAAFSSLASIAILAAHKVAGKEITPSSVLELLPVSTSLAVPADAQTS